MILTKHYFKKFQFYLLLVCIVAAAVIGSVQTGLIIKKSKNKAQL